MKFKSHPQALTWHEILSFLAVLLSVLVFIFLSLNYRSFYLESLSGPDKIIEWLTLPAYLLGCFACWYRVKILRPFRGRVFRRVQFFIGLLFLSVFLFKSSFLADRFWSLFTYDFLRTLEIITLLLAIFYFIFLPLFYRQIKNVREWTDYLAIPVPKWTHLIFLIFLIVLVPFADHSGQREILIFAVSWTFVVMVIRPYNRRNFSRRSLKY